MIRLLYRTKATLNNHEPLVSEGSIFQADGIIIGLNNPFTVIFRNLSDFGTIYMENLARYIIRASFSQERMTYLPEESKVIYQSKDGKEEKIFDALEWLAAMCSHVPNKGQQMVRYVGFYSNVARGKRKKNDQDELIPSILEPGGSAKEYKRNWARLIQKIYEVDPLTCPRCSGKMKVISIIERPEIIKKILRHLGLWEKKARPPPKTGDLKTDIDTSDSQRPACEDHLYRDPEYPIEAYVS